MYTQTNGLKKSQRSEIYRKILSLLLIHKYLNRLYFYIPIIYGASKVYQWSFNQNESCWQMLWNFIQIQIGDRISNLYIFCEFQLFIKSSGPDPFNYCVLLFNGYLNLFFWTFGLSLMTAEYFNIAGMKNVKIQKNRDTLANKSKVGKVRMDFELIFIVKLDRNFITLIQAMAFICLNQLINFTMSWLSFVNGNMLKITWTRELPSFMCVMMDLLVFFWTHEILVYYSHRVMHHKLIYKYVHKMHHEFNAPVSVTAMYTHPIENFFSSTADIAAFSFTKSHIMTCLLWMTITALTGLVDHSGLDLPLMPDSKWHDYHHQT